MHGAVISSARGQQHSTFVHLRLYHWEKEMIKKIIIACNDQSVLQIFSACSENDSMEYFLCNVIWSLIWEKIVHFTCITEYWYVFCPC